MPKIEIIPAHSPDVQCEFVIPRDKKTPIEFSVPRFDYIPDFDTKMLAWQGERMAPVPVVDDNGDPVLNTDGTAKTEPAELLTEREVILKQLEVAGVTAGKLRELAKLTNGELTQIFQAWEAASRVKVGESVASDNS